MGIQGLLRLLKDASETIDLKDFSGSVAVIDAYCWLHRAVSGCYVDLYFERETDMYVKYCLSRINKLKEIGIDSIMVFDGQSLPSKEHTETIRRKTRENTRVKIQKLFKIGNKKEAFQLMKRCVDVTPEMAKKVIDACRKKNVDYIVAPYEADAQIAYLMKKQIGHFVITEDSDLLLFGSNYVLVKLDFDNLKGQLYCREKIGDCLRSQFSDYNFQKFRWMCIASGCDYLPNLKNIGLKRALKFFGSTDINNTLDLYLQLPKIYAYLKLNNCKNSQVDKRYIENFVKAENTFKYQLVFCPIEKKLVPLNPYPSPSSLSPEEKKHLNNVDYAGKQVDNDFAFDLALGNVDLTSGKKNDSWIPHESMTRMNDDDDVNYKNGQLSIWSKSFEISKTGNPFELKYGQKITENIDGSSKANQISKKEKGSVNLLLNEVLTKQEIKMKRVLSSGGLFQPKKKVNGIDKSISNFYISIFPQNKVMLQQN